jgi:hypothetical protein
MHMRTIFAISVLALTALVGLAPAADAAVAPPGMPPRGKVLLGLGGTALNPTQFGRLTGSQHKLHLITVNWDERREQGWHYALIRQFEAAKAGNYRLVIHIGASKTNGVEGRSPGAVAAGAADAYLLDLGREINEEDVYVYVRPPAEMNGHWSTWSAFNKNGSRRNSQHSTTQYKRAFMRIAEIVRGGSVTAINARLKLHGMRPLRTSASTLPASGKVALIWNPQAEGSPNVKGNQPADYYPGKRYVDYVATDMYEQHGKAAWAQNNAFYAKYAKVHPFMVAEFAPWGYDGASYVSRMFAWVAARPRIVALMYFNGTGGSTFRLSSKPKTLRTYKKLAKAARYRCAGFSGTSTRC